MCCQHTHDVVPIADTELQFHGGPCLRELNKKRRHEIFRRGDGADPQRSAQFPTQRRDFFPCFIPQAEDFVCITNHHLAGGGEFYFAASPAQ